MRSLVVRVKYREPVGKSLKNEQCCTHKCNIYIICNGKSMIEKTLGPVFANDFIRAMVSAC